MEKVFITAFVCAFAWVAALGFGVLFLAFISLIVELIRDFYHELIQSVRNVKTKHK